MFCGPRSRGNFWDALDGCVCKAGQDVGEVVAHWDFEAAAAFDYREDRGYTWPGLFTSDVDPVFSTQGHAAHGIFREVVAELQFQIIEEADELFPDSHRVVAGLTGSAFGQHRLTHLQDVSADLGEKRRGLLVAQSMAGGMVHVAVARLGID